MTDFWATICKTVRPMLSDHCLSVCNVGVLWPTVEWIRMKLGMEAGAARHIVLDRDPAPVPKRAQPPNFRPMFVVAKRLDGSRSHLVRR